MMRRIWTAYTVELAKALRQKYTYVGPLLVILAVLTVLARRINLQEQAGDYAFILAATELALHVIGLTMLLIYSAGLISGDLASGSIRVMLLRPLRRHEYVAAKLLHAMTYAVLITVLAGSLSWGCAAVGGNLRGALYGGELVYSGGAMLRAYLIGALLGLLPLWAAASYALFVSACTHSPMTAACVAIGGWILADVIKYPLGIAPALFTTHVETPWSVFAAYGSGLPASWGGVAAGCVLSSVPAAAVFTAGAAYVLHRRNLA